jgi:diadenosine tetraphosphate (Ap4A) HIT family hydrolase
MNNWKKHVNLDNARLADQRQVMERIKQNDVCPFCPENLADYHKKPILFETASWVVTENQWPYQGTLHHFLLILKRHATHPVELNDNEWNEIHIIINNLTKDYTIEAGSFLLRFGSTEKTGATVDHLHAHVIVPNSKNKNRQPIITRVG